MKSSLVSIVNHIIMSLPFWFIGYTIGKHFKLKERETHKRKFWQCCLYCKYTKNKGLQSYNNKSPYLYCLHPDNDQVWPVDRIEPNFYCGKFEVCEAFAIELGRMNAEKALKENSNLDRESRMTFKGSKK